MSLIMSSSFEPSLSTSTMRPPLLSADAPSMADTLPSINFGFEELRDRMAKFTTRFDTFIEQGRKRVLEERNQFRMNVAELKEDQRMKKKDIEIMTSKTDSHQQTLAKEAAETNEIQTMISSLSAQRDSHFSTREELRQRITDTQKQIDTRLAAQKAHAQHVEGLARFNEPELDFWESTLCLTIDGAGQVDRLKFTFTHIDDRDWNREAFFELSTAAVDYEVVYCKPKLEKEKVDRVIDRWNETKDFRIGVKEMRELFVEAMKGA